jgi:hypothetical protein
VRKEQGSGSGKSVRLKRLKCLVSGCSGRLTGISLSKGRPENTRVKRGMRGKGLRSFPVCNLFLKVSRVDQRAAQDVVLAAKSFVS